MAFVLFAFIVYLGLTGRLQQYVDIVAKDAAESTKADNKTQQRDEFPVLPTLP